MAKDIITRFKLETTGFDSKIKEAAKNLSAYSKTATQAKEGFNQFTKANVDAARALGTMATSTTNVKDRVKELVGAYNDAAKAYEALTKEQQQSDWAKALAGSLTQLQQRIKETKAEMQGLSADTKGGIFSGLSGKMEGALAVFGGNMMTKAAGAIASLGTEMFNSVQQGIELAKQGEGIRLAFERLGNGQILQGLREATHGTVTDIELMKAAVKFNDFKLPLDQLGTMLAFAQQKAKDTGQSVDYMVESITNGLGRQSKPILDNLGISAKEIEERMKSTGDFTKAVGEIIRDQMKAAGDYVETAADRAAQANVSLQNKMEELGRKFAPLEEASNSLWTSMKIGILDIIGGPLATLLNQLTEAGRIRNEMQNMGGSESVNKQLGALRLAKGRGATGYMSSRYNQDIAEYQKQISDLDFKIAAFGKGRDSIERGHIERLKEQKAAVQALMAEYKQGAKQIMNATNTANAAVTGGMTTTTKGSGGNKTVQTELQQNQAKINTLTQEYVKLGEESTESSRQRQAEIQREIQLLKERNGLLGLRAEQAQGRFTLGAGDFQRDGLSNNGLLGNPFATDDKATDIKGSLGLQLDPSVLAEAQKDADSYIDQLIKGAKQTEKAWGMAGQAVQGIGSAFAMIDDPAAKVAGTVMQAIASVALGFAMASKSADTVASGWGWLAWLGAGATAMATTIATIHSLTGYASGGVIKGNSYSGDNIMGMVDGGGGGLVGLNAGEIVLNKAQTASVANELTNNQPRAMRVNGRISGHDIVLAADRSLAQEGKGHIVTWK